MNIWRLPSGYTASQIVYAVRHARQHPEDTYRTPHGQDMTGREFVRWFRGRLNAKINRGIQPRGRKCASDGFLSDWERHALQVARAVNTPRLIVRVSEVALEFRARLTHRLYGPEDF